MALRKHVGTVLVAFIFSMLAPAGSAFASAEVSDLITTEIEQNGVYVQSGGGTSPEMAEFVPGEVIVKFKDLKQADNVLRGKKQSSASLNTILQKADIREAKALRKAAKKGSTLERTVKLKAATQSKEQTLALVDVLRQQPEVEYAEPNYILHTTMVPNDPYYGTSGAWTQSFLNLWGLDKLDAETAWDTSTGTGVIVAVIDTGIDAAHVDLAANMTTNGWDFVNNDNNPSDDHGHGTHVAGTIAAVANNSLGIVGVAPAAKVMALKAFNGGGSGQTDDIVEAILYAADNGADVINASFGGQGITPQTILDAVTEAHDTAGVVFVAAAGNSNLNIGTVESGFYPASIRDTIAVSAFDHLDLKASFSNFGIKLDVAAPGGGNTVPGGISDPHRSVMSLKASGAVPGMTGNGQFVINSNYLRQAGTSMAAPHVSGVAALLLALNPDWTPEEVRQAIRKGSDDTGATGFDTQAGYGRVNAAGALAVTAPLAAQITAPTTAKINGSDPVAIAGNAYGDDFAEWTLEYGAGTDPTSWTEIASDTLPVTEGTLTTWDFSGLADGPYVLRLTVSNSTDETFVDRLPVTIDRILITQPSPTVPAAFRAGAPIEIHGAVTPINLQSYTITVTKSDNTTLANPVISYVGSTTEPITGHIATWDTTGVPSDHYTINLRVTLNGAPLVQKTTKVVVDELLHVGWPQNIPPVPSSVGFLAYLDGVTTADLDGDGTEEILVGYGSSVYAFRHDGTQLPGWPQTIDPLNNGAIVQVGPAVGELDGDSTPEIVSSGEDDRVFVWNADGTAVSGWPKVMAGGRHAAFTIDDVNGDGTNEILMATRNTSKMHVMNLQGTDLPGWPQSPVGVGSSATLANPLVGDINGDGNKEVIIMSQRAPQKIFPMSSTGQLLPGWPKAASPLTATGTAVGSNATLADLDGDGRLDILTGGGDGRVHAFRYDGTILPGWPQQAKPSSARTPTVGDIDGDGEYEVVVGYGNVNESGTLANYIAAWHRDGTVVSGWPVKYDKTISNSYFGYSMATIADIDGDGTADVLASSDSTAGKTFALNAYKGDGSKVAGFPRPTLYIGAHNRMMPAVSDIDDDGMFEIIWLDGLGNLSVYDLTAADTTPRPWPMYQRDAAHRGRLDAPDALDPVVSITAPSEGAFFSGATIAIAATATDASGIAEVEFFGNSISVGTDATSPYTADWDITALTDGAHTVHATAVDTASNTGTSAVINVVIDRTAPTVSLTAPEDEAGVSGTIAVSADASDVNTLSVTFYRDAGVSLGVDSEAPYSVDWNTVAVSDGAHTLYALARDAAGNETTTASRSVTVSNDNTPPEVAVTAPANGSIHSGSSLNVLATASDASGVTGVEFFADGSGTPFASDATDPYTAAWNIGALSEGQHTLLAVADDTVGNTGTSATISVTIDRTGPTVALTAPANGATVSGTAVTVSADATDANGVTKVTFYRDTGVEIGSDTSAPFSIAWNTIGTSNGSHTIYAVASDTVNNRTTSATRSVTISNDVTPPTVSLTAPANGAAVQGNITVSATASDSGGINRVEFYYGTTLIATDTTSPYSITWNTTLTTDGVKSITAKAFDQAQNFTTSAARTVTVDNISPAVSITSPLNGAIVPRSATTVIQATASDAVGVTQVQFRVNGSLKCTDTTAPYSCNWSVPNARNAPYTLQARAYDAIGHTTNHSINVTSSN